MSAAQLWWLTSRHLGIVGDGLGNAGRGKRRALYYRSAASEHRRTKREARSTNIISHVLRFLSRRRQVCKQLRRTTAENTIRETSSVSHIAFTWWAVESAASHLAPSFDALSSLFVQFFLGHVHKEGIDLTGRRSEFPADFRGVWTPNLWSAMRGAIQV